MYVTSPLQVGVVDIAGADGVSVLPQLSVTVGTVGVAIDDAHATVDAPLAGITKSVLSIV